jgi:rare lipoprotein A
MKPFLRRLLVVSVASLLPGCGGGSYAGYKIGGYRVKGVRYQPLSPQEAIGYTEEGVASHYQEGWFLFPGKDALGGSLYPWSSGAAHKTLPLPCVIRVTNLENGRRAKVRVTDRGPFISDRMLDVTSPVAKKLGFYDQGLARVRIEVLSVGDGRYRVDED